MTITISRMRSSSGTPSEPNMPFSLEATSLADGRQSGLEDRAEGTVGALLGEQPAYQPELPGKETPVDLAASVGHGAGEGSADLPGPLQEDPLEPLTEGAGIPSQGAGETLDDRVGDLRGHPGERRPLPKERRQIVGVRAGSEVLKIDRPDRGAHRKEVVSMVVAMAEHLRMRGDLLGERLGPRVVSRAIARRQRGLEPQLEDRLARQIELATEEGRIEAGVDARIGRAREERRAVRGPLEPGRAVLGLRGKKRCDVDPAEVLDQLIALLIVGDERGNAHASAQDTS